MSKDTARKREECFEVEPQAAPTENRKPAITEKTRLVDAWMLQAKGPDITLETLPDFLDGLINGWEHDYGTIVHAMAAAAIATVRAVDHSDQGGITGFQASAVVWEFMKGMQFLNSTGPARIIEFDKFLYPGAASELLTLDYDTVEWLKDQARKFLERGGIGDSLQKHLEAIRDGDLSFFRFRTEVEGQHEHEDQRQGDGAKKRGGRR